MHDTVVAYVTSYVHDTVFTHDTIVAYITQFVHDTVYDVQHDTVIAFITQYVHDTVLTVDTITVLDLDTVTVDHYVFDTIYTTDTLYVYDTVYIHDTVYITQEGIDPTDATSVTLYASAGRIVVEGAEGLPVRMYDMSGRMIYSGRPVSGTPLSLPVPSSGAYLVKIGDFAARKIVVVR